MNTPETEKQTCDSTASDLLSVDSAKQKVLDYIDPLDEYEEVNIRSSLNRVLGMDVLSSVNVPPCDNSAMDGYAVVGADLPITGTRKLLLIGESFAGNPFNGTVKAGQCVRIMTGAVIPDGTDTVIMQEHIQRDGKNISIPAGYKAGENKRCAGEDMHVGQKILNKGKLIGPTELGVLASLGLPLIQVFRRARVAFFSTGDELIEVGKKLEKGQIYDSNRYTLYGMLDRLGVEIQDLGVIRDDKEEIRKAFLSAAKSADAIITTGGVSVGEADFVKDVLDEIGEINFWKVAIKPGKPMAMGNIKNVFFFGLPGNPVSSMVTFYQFVRPALNKLAGQEATTNISFRVPCMTELKKRPGRLEYQRGTLEKDDDGNLVVRSSGMQGSHMLTSMSNANCLIVLPAENSGIAIGEEVEVEPLQNLMY